LIVAAADHHYRRMKPMQQATGQCDGSMQRGFHQARLAVIGVTAIM
jgi:hypothetical protein